MDRINLWTASFQSRKRSGTGTHSHLAFSEPLRPVGPKVLPILSDFQSFGLGGLLEVL